MINLFFGSIRDKREEKFTSICRNCAVGFFLAPWLLLADGPGETKGALGGAGPSDHRGVGLQRPAADNEASPHPALSLEGIHRAADAESRVFSLHSSPGGFTASLFPARMESLPHRPERGSKLDEPNRLAPLEGGTFAAALTLESGTMPLQKLGLGQPPVQSPHSIGVDAGRDRLAVPRIHSEISEEPDSGAFFFSAGDFRETFLNGAGGPSDLSAGNNPADSPLTQIIPAHPVLPYRNFLRTDLFRYFPEERMFDPFDGLK